MREKDQDDTLLKAAAEGQLPRVKHLLHLGADVNHYDDLGFGALHHGVLSGFEDVVLVLLEAGADVNAQSNHFGTPLCLASLKGRENIINLLLRYRANVNLAGKACGSPLHCAVYAKDMLSIAQTLIDHGAKVEHTQEINRWMISGFISDPASTGSPNIGTKQYPIVWCRPSALASVESRDDLIPLLGPRVPFEDAHIAYLDLLIIEEQAKLIAGGDTRRLLSLTEDRYKQQQAIRATTRNMDSTDDRLELIESDNVCVADAVVDDNSSNRSSTFEYAIAKFSFRPDQPGDLGFEMGEIITIVKRTKSTNDRWTGRIGGTTGIFPSNYVEVLWERFEVSEGGDRYQRLPPTLAKSVDTPAAPARNATLHSDNITS